MTPGEVLDFEIGAKKPTAEIVDRLAGALGAAPYELTRPPEQVEAARAEDKQTSQWATEQRLNMGAQELLEERSNPAYQRIRDAYEKNESERQAERGRKDKLA